MIIRLKVFEQTLSIVDTRSVPRKGSKDYLALQFLFSSDWKDLNKVCYLQHGDVSQPIDVVDNLVKVPEWFTEQDSFDVTLFGKSGTQEVPTNVVSLRLEKSNTLWEQDAPEPQPSWLAKIIDINDHPPAPGANGYWLIWDTEQGAYVESTFPLPAGSGGFFEETDPTVPEWAKQPTKPAYTAAEVGALPDTYTPPNQTAQQVGADPAGTATTAVSQHNVDTAAHNDLRLALQELANRVNAALDSDDTTLDQMSEVVAYIKSNKTLIEAITTSKVSVTDIVNDLVTNVEDKPLSAAQGVVIKTLIDALRNDKLDAAELTNAVNTALSQAKASGEFDGKPGSDANVTADNIKSALGYTPADSAALSGKQDKPIIKTAMDAIAVAWAQYYLGNQTAVSIVLPDNAEIGQMITVCWYNGSTAATLSITGMMLPCDYAPSANSRSEVNALWDGRYWSIVCNEAEVPS